LTALIIVLIIVATIAVAIAIWELVNRYSPLRIRRFRIWRLGLAPAAGAPANLALARAAYDRGDYLRVCEILDTDWVNQPMAAQLLLADACSELGTVKGDEGSAAVFEYLSGRLQAEWIPRRDALRQAKQDSETSGTPVDPSLLGWGKDVDDLPWRERAILDRFLQEHPDLLQLSAELAPPTGGSGSPLPAQPTTVADLLTDTRFSWEKLCRRVSDDKKKAEKKTKLWRFCEIAAGGLSAVLAAAAGGTALLKGTGGNATSSVASGASKVVAKGAGAADAAAQSGNGVAYWIFGLSLLSALVTALIVLVKPAQRAEEAVKEASGLEQLMAAIDLFEDRQRQTDADKRGDKLEVATAEVRKRSRAAKGLAPPRELV
jgi:hypothetical protein